MIRFEIMNIKKGFLNTMNKTLIQLNLIIWKTLNRLRAGVAKTKANMVK